MVELRRSEKQLNEAIGGLAKAFHQLNPLSFNEHRLS